MDSEAVLGTALTDAVKPGSWRDFLCCAQFPFAPCELCAGQAECLKEMTGRGLKVLIADRGERIKNEEGCLGSIAEPSAAALTLVPQPAGHPQIITPHNLARCWMLGDGLSVR